MVKFLYRFRHKAAQPRPWQSIHPEISMSQEAWAEEDHPKYKVLKYSSTAVTQWSYEYANGPGANSYDIAVSRDGTSAYITGDTSGNSYRTIKLNTTTGKGIWTNIYSSGIAYGITVDTNNTFVYVTGNDNNNITTIKIDAGTGVAVWTNIFDSGGTDGGFDVALSPAGDYLYAVGNSGGDFITLKISTSPKVTQWTRKYDSGQVGDQAQNVAVDKAGNIMLL